jgi:hypothetical protein
MEPQLLARHQRDLDGGDVPSMKHRYDPLRFSLTSILDFDLADF